LRFSLDKIISDFVLFEPTFSEARRVGTPRWSSEAAAGGRANTLTIYSEISSNFSKNEHHLGNGEIVGCGARNAAARCERRKGKIQVCREPP